MCAGKISQALFQHQLKHILSAKSSSKFDSNTLFLYIATALYSALWRLWSYQLLSFDAIYWLCIHFLLSYYWSPKVFNVLLDPCILWQLHTLPIHQYWHHNNYFIKCFNSNDRNRSYKDCHGSYIHTQSKTLWLLLLLDFTAKLHEGCRQCLPTTQL